MDNTKENMVKLKEKITVIPKFHWSAGFDNGDILHQFDEKGKEVKFEKVENRMPGLVKFRIESKEGEFGEVDLMNGIITLNNQKRNIFEVEDKAELIYYRKVFLKGHETAEGDLKTDEVIIKHTIGMRYKGTAILESFEQIGAK